MLNFVLCDDNFSVLTKLHKMLDAIFIKNNYDATIVFESDNPIDIINYSKDNFVNVFILDIDLKSEINGLYLASELRKHNKNAYIIFTTGHIEYVLQAYKVKTFDFLPKPIVYERLEDTIIRLFNDICSTNNKFIRLSNKTILNQNDIDYIKRDGMKLVFCASGNTFETYSSFNKIENCLSENFVRCHKSYIVNIKNIVTVDFTNNIIKFKNDCCYIGPKYKSEFMEVFNHEHFSKHLGSTN